MQAEEPTTLVGDLADLAAAMELPEAAQADQQLAVGAVRRWLEDHDRWLLVLDNAQGPQTATGLLAPLEYLANVLPRVVHGQVLVTSRDASWDSQATLIELDLLSSQEAIRFLLLRTGSGDQQAAAEVAELLGYLALALEQAGAYVRETRISLADYLDRLRQYPVRALAKGRPRDRNPADTVATTWQVSLERVGRTPGAAALLEACAFLAPDDIPRKLFTELVDGQPKELVELATDSFAFDDAVAALLRYSLVTATHQTLTVHRLVQAVVRDGLSPELQRHWAAAATRLVTAAFPDGSNDVRTWPACARLLPHVLAVVDHAQVYGVEPVATALLLNEAGLYLWSRGQYQQARMLHEQALAIRGRELGDDDPDTLQSMSNLAETRRALGDFRGAHELHEKTLTARRRVLSGDNRDTLQSMNSLALTRRQLGNLRDARQLFEQTLAARQRILGDDHPETLWTMNNLAETRRALGQLQAARELHCHTLAGYRRVLGKDHPTTLIARNSRAVTRHHLGKLRSARRLHEQILATRRRVLGDDHPETLWSMHSLAAIRRDLRDLQGAQELFEETLAARMRVLSDDHSDTLWTMHGLAEALRNGGQLQAAHNLHVQTLATRLRVLGDDDHPDTLRSMNSLAMTRRALGKLRDAHQLFEQTLAARKRVLGDDHPETLWTLYGLAETHRDLGNLQRALEVHEQTLTIRRRVLGDDHPDTLASMNNLAQVRRDLDQL